VQFAHWLVIIFSNFASSKHQTLQFASSSQMMALSQIESLIESFEKDASLLEPENFDERADALDFIEFYIIEPLQFYLQSDSEREELMRLKSRIETLKLALGRIDDKLFEQLRAEIISGECRGKAFEDLVGQYFDIANLDSSREGYDNLDVFINRVLSNREIPEPTREPSPEMVSYQKTPARVVFEIARKVGFKEKEVFFDIGSGLGQVAILINLIAGISTRGIEFEPAFCNYAQDCAASLNASGTTFINTNACEADYSDGTVFFLYTPFKGDMLQQVLQRLKEESINRPITIITHGPCTTEVIRENWLKPIKGNNGESQLAFFKSI